MDGNASKAYEVSIKMLPVRIIMHNGPSMDGNASNA